MTWIFRCALLLLILAAVGGIWISSLLWALLVAAFVLFLHGVGLRLRP